MTEIVIAVVALLAPVAAWFVATWRGKAIGKKEAEYHATEADIKRANDLYRLGRRVQRDNPVKYRD